MKKLLISAVVIVVLAGAAWLIFGGSIKSEKAEFQFATVSRGNLESTISATGTLSPVTTVEIGTQVSGTIDSVFVDYNDEVKAGQLLAVLDTSLLKTQVLDAEAGLERAEAAMEQAQSDYDRNKGLFERQLISEADFLNYKVSLKTQQASLKSAQSALQRAQKNLEYAVITSPINGIVIEKNVESGQTVAASFSTPTLFLIAQDLSHMEILAQVDESDIGSIKVGQPVRFEVQTYSDKEFEGTVRQIRMQPEVVSNVVTYTVVIEASNNQGWLMPGMTATVDFITESKSDVLLVANKALRFQPSEEEMQAFFERRQKEMAALPDSVKAERRDAAQSRFAVGGQSGDIPSSTQATAQTGTQTGTSGGMRTGQRPKDMGTVWYLDANGQLAMEPVRTGMTDGTNTEIIHSRDLAEGSQVIVGTASTGTTTTQNNNRRMGFGPPRF